jgi:hypothetical protein
VKVMKQQEKINCEEREEREKLKILQKNLKLMLFAHWGEKFLKLKFILVRLALVISLSLSLSLSQGKWKMFIGHIFINDDMFLLLRPFDAR